MRSFWSVNYAFSLVAAAGCVVLFVIALVNGLGVKSVIILAAGAFWVLMARGDRRRLEHQDRRRRRRARDRTSSGPPR